MKEYKILSRHNNNIRVDFKRIESKNYLKSDQSDDGDEEYHECQSRLY